MIIIMIYRVLPPNIKFNSPGFNPYSQEVQDLLKTTNLRVTFTKLHTLGDEKLQESNAINIREKYYYSIYDMVVRGSCSCYGHAARCIPEKEEHKDIPGMVHGKCECDHNTKGNNCEHCMDFYQDVPWNPATGKLNPPKPKKKDPRTEVLERLKVMSGVQVSCLTKPFNAGLVLHFATWQHQK